MPVEITSLITDTDELVQARANKIAKMRAQGAAGGWASGDAPTRIRGKKLPPGQERTSLT